MWTNADAVQSINRSAGVDIAWTGGAPDTKVWIQGVVLPINPTTFQAEGGGSFTCLENNSAGHFFVSPEVLTLLPPSPPPVIPGLGATLSVSDGVEVKFDARGTDLNLFTYQAGTSRVPDFK